MSLCNLAYAEYAYIGTSPKGVQVSINMDPRFFTSVDTKSNSLYGDSNDVIFKFWNKGIYKEPIIIALCTKYVSGTLGLPYCIKSENFAAFNATYVSYFNLTKNTYCDEQSNFYDKNGKLIDSRTSSCYSGIFKLVEPDSTNDFINSYLTGQWNAFLTKKATGNQ